MTATLLPFPGHQWQNCSCERSGCGICQGGLAVCRRCNGMEGSLPTDCPGERMDEERERRVYAGEIDYRRRRGWVIGASKYSPRAYRYD